MRYTLFFTYCLLAIAYCLLPAPCSLKPRDLYLMGMRFAIYRYHQLKLELSTKFLRLGSVTSVPGSSHD
ncbi:MAG: hypothetical protein F6K56_22320 [Moorea sp. SIO3G5]|nr:hypothetical protein [Moorena sp. SIO3G5]